MICIVTANITLWCFSHSLHHSDVTFLSWIISIRKETTSAIDYVNNVILITKQEWLGWATAIPILLETKDFYTPQFVKFFYFTCSLRDNWENVFLTITTKKNKILLNVFSYFRFTINWHSLSSSYCLLTPSKTINQVSNCIDWNLVTNHVYSDLFS